jgi:hypothetical protein
MSLKLKHLTRPYRPFNSIIFDSDHLEAIASISIDTLNPQRNDFRREYNHVIDSLIVSVAILELWSSASQG